MTELSQTSDPRAIDHCDNPDRVWFWMRALGRSPLPASVELQGDSYRLVQSVKHDFVAATGFYENQAGQRVVLKIGRVAPMLGIPMCWMGRFLCRREMRFYRRLQDLPNIPRLLGAVGETGFVHEYVHGHPLADEAKAPPEFFAQCHAILAEIHRRGMAYVDTNKPENILVGDDGLPHLIDFQISWDYKFMLNRMQQEDIYHLLKLKKRFSREALTADELYRVEHRSFLIRLHRAVSKPYFFVRRRLFKRLRESGRLMPEGSK